MKTKSKILLAGSIIIGMMGLLIFMGVAQTASYYLTVDEFFERKDQLSNRSVKISGFIIGDSVRYDEANLILEFDIKDEEGQERLSVHYQGIKPDTFIDGWETIIEGRPDEKGTLIATDLLVKCPSKYEAEEEEGYDYDLENMYTD